MGQCCQDLHPSVTPTLFAVAVQEFLGAAWAELGLLLYWCKGVYFYLNKGSTSDAHLIIRMFSNRTAEKGNFYTEEYSIQKIESEIPKKNSVCR